MKSIFLPILLLSVTTLGIFYATQDRNPTEEPSWQIGLPLCLTGPCAADGDSTLKGAQLAASELNAQGGVLGRKVRLVVEDTAEASSGAKAVTAYRRLRLNPQINFIVGPTWTPGGLALAPIIEKERNIIAMSPSLGVSDYNTAAENIFNNRGADEIATRKLAQFAFEKGWKRIATFSSAQPWESAQAGFFAEEFRSLGGVVSVSVEPHPDTTQLHSEALKVVSSKPDAVFYSTVIQLAIATKELRALGFKGPQLAAYVDDTRIAEADGALDNTYTANISSTSSWFKEKFDAAYPKKALELPAATGYDAVMLYALAIREAKSFSTIDVQQALLRSNYRGATGNITFDKFGGAQRKPSIQQLRNKHYLSITK